MPSSSVITKSDSLFSESLKFTPCGTQTLSKAPNRYVNGVYPKLVTNGRGSHLFDHEGNEYIDWIAGLGAISLGYADIGQNAIIATQLSQGIVFSLPHEFEGQVARRISEVVPSMEMSKFTKTGSDATSMAIKCARAYTGRDGVAVCGYHGWHDWYTIVNDKKAGIPAFNADLVVRLAFNDVRALMCVKWNELACVIIEPMVFEFPDQAFLQMLIAQCNAHGVLLIFDEVVTGGRFDGFTAQDYFKVTPDLTVLSKGIANGMPLAVVGGRRDIMATFERDDFFASTTFGGECLSLASCLYTIEELLRQIPSMVKKGEKMQAVFNNAFDEVRCEGYATRTRFSFKTVPHKALFWQECVKRGVLFGYSNLVMAAHSDADIDKTCAVIEDAARVVKENWASPESKLEGDMPVEVLRLK